MLLTWQVQSMHMILLQQCQLRLVRSCEGTSNCSKLPKDAAMKHQASIATSARFTRQVPTGATTHLEQDGTQDQHQQESVTAHWSRHTTSQGTLQDTQDVRTMLGHVFVQIAQLGSMSRDVASYYTGMHARSFRKSVTRVLFCAHTLEIQCGRSACKAMRGCEMQRFDR